MGGEEMDLYLSQFYFHVSENNEHNWILNSALQFLNLSRNRLLCCDFSMVNVQVEIRVNISDVLRQNSLNTVKST